jgi:uncharacterized phage infection (PIP) family protein YhgE
MPSVSDIYNELLQVNINLQQLHTDLGAVDASTDAVKASTDAVKSSVDQAVNRLDLLKSGQDYTNQILFHLSQQTDTMICILEKISRNTCGIWNEAHTQTGVETAIQSATSDSLEIQKYAHADAALELSRQKDMRRQIEACCPPPVAEPVCRYEPCWAPGRLQERRDDQPPPIS